MNYRAFVCDMNPIKKVGQVVKSTTIPTNNNIPQTSQTSQPQNTNTITSEPNSISSYNDIVADTTKSISDFIKKAALEAL